MNEQYIQSDLKTINERAIRTSHIIILSKYLLLRFEVESLNQNKTCILHSECYISQMSRKIFIHFTAEDGDPVERLLSWKWEQWPRN